MSNYTGGNRLPRHNPNLHGSSKSLWDVKSRLTEGPARKFASIYASSVSLSPSGTNLSVLGAERRPKKTSLYGLAARNRIRSLARFRFASSCDNVAAARHHPSDKERRHTVYSARNAQRHSGQLSSVPSEGNLFIDVRFNTLNSPQKVGRGQRSYSTSTLVNGSQPEPRHINVVGIAGGESRRFLIQTGHCLIPRWRRIRLRVECANRF